MFHVIICILRYCLTSRDQQGSRLLFLRPCCTSYDQMCRFRWCVPLHGSPRLFARCRMTTSRPPACTRCALLHLFSAKSRVLPQQYSFSYEDSTKSSLSGCCNAALAADWRRCCGSSPKRKLYYTLFALVTLWPNIQVDFAVSDSCVAALVEPYVDAKVSVQCLMTSLSPVSITQLISRNYFTQLISRS